MKKFISLILTFILTFSISSVAFASVLGSNTIDSYSFYIGKDTTFTNQVILSDQNGVGKQTENYITYSPSDAVEPLITFGTSLYGTDKISNEVSRLSNIYNLAGGINADFFSLETGVPLGNLIIDGNIISKDASEQETLGIMEDGTAFIDKITFSSTLSKEDGTILNIYNINKYRQPYSAYLFTKDFAATTKTKTPGIDVVLGSIKGEMKLGGTISAVIEDISENETEVLIPDDKFILSIDKNAPEEFLAPISSLAVGDKVTLSFGAIGEDTRWNKAKLAMGSVGGRLLTNGEIYPDLEKGAAPRTAVGIKKDGSIIFYTIDGRQQGYSYGVQLTTLAQRLKELGCTDAINLDGGGSTSIVALTPGDGVPTLMNKPSDGKERGVSTFLFLKNNLNPTGKLGTLTIYPYSAYILKGSTINFSVKAADTNFHPITLPKNIKFSVETDDAKSHIDAKGNFTANDSKKITIKAEANGVSAYRDIVCLDTPTDIHIKDKGGKQISSLSLKGEEKVQLFAEAFGGYNKLIADDDCFSWQVKGDIGEIDKNGMFTAKKNQIAKGEILVTAGKTTKSIPVSVSFTPDEMDKDNYPKITIAKGEEERSFYVKTSTPSGIPAIKDSIIIKADGNEIDFEFDEETETASFVAPSDAARISVYVSNISALSSFGAFDLENFEYTNIFADAKEHWAEKVLSKMYEIGIISGEKSGDKLIFRPQKQMTRSEFAVMIANYLKLDLTEFKDVELPFEDKAQIPIWAEDATKALYKKEISKGKKTDKNTLICEPNSPITRAEATTIIARTLDKKIFIEDFSYNDMNDIPTWAEHGMKTLMTMGALSGYEDKTIRPLGLLTKAEAAKLLYSIL